MKEIKLIYKGTLIVLLSVLLIINYVTTKSAQAPQQPSDFYGSITIDGLGAEIGTIISPWINGIQKPNDFTVTALGNYGFMHVEQGSDGDIVRFKVYYTGQWYDANEFATYRSGFTQRRDLTVSTSPTTTTTTIPATTTTTVIGTTTTTTIIGTTTTTISGITTTTTTTTTSSTTTTIPTICDNDLVCEVGESCTCSDCPTGVPFSCCSGMWAEGQIVIF